MTDPLGLLMGLLAMGIGYLLAGLVVAMLTGGRDPLSFGPSWVIPTWPVVVFVALVGTAIMWVADSEAE